MINFKTKKSELIVKICAVLDCSIAERAKLHKNTKSELIKIYTLALMGEFYSLGVLCRSKMMNRIKKN